MVLKKRKFDEPVMSDATILVSVEDLINIAMGPAEQNIVNFKMIKTVLHILARQLRMLETQVEIRISELEPDFRKRLDSSASSSPTRSPPRKERMKRGKEEKGRDKDKERGKKSKDKADRAEAREKEKEERASTKEREKIEKADAKGKDKADKAASKDKETAENDREKAEKAASKEKDKTEKTASKDKTEKDASKDKTEKAASKDKTEKDASKDKGDQKDKERVEKADRKEKDRAEMTAPKGKDNGGKLSQKGKETESEAIEREKMDKMSPREREKYLKQRQKDYELKKKNQMGSTTNLAATEGERGKDKVVIVEKGPTTRSEPRTRVGSIEVVTISQFELLEEAVNKLKQAAGPLPMPAMPDNEKLRSDLARGNASLTDTMQAMQVTARVKAAEQGIERMAWLLTQLAQAGALPDDVLDTLQDMKADLEAAREDAEEAEVLARPLHSIAGRKSVAIDPMTSKASRTDALVGKPSTISRHSAKSISAMSATSRASTMGISPPVTRVEMADAMESLRNDLTKNVGLLTNRANVSADTAANTARAVSERFDVALKLNSRISTLYGTVTDYADQLNGFDAGLTTQMQSFQEQMAQIRGELKGGLAQLETANNNAETAAVMELNERYEELAQELEHTLTAHQHLGNFQKQLGNELHSLLEAVEVLREQKADRDEVLDGLRDKADNSKLEGLLREEEFMMARAELDRRLELCYDKFHKQDLVWMTAIKDLSYTAEGKAEIMQLQAVKDEAQQALRDIHETMAILASQLGEPKAAILMRMLSRDGKCAACHVSALMEPTDPCCGQPPPLPALRPPPDEGPCEPQWKASTPVGIKGHTCLRWVGGSHTLLTDGVTRRQAAPLPLVQGPPTKKFTGYGTDGRLYMMEEELTPCIECNKMTTDKMPEEMQDALKQQDVGGGDAKEASQSKDTPGQDVGNTGKADTEVEPMKAGT